MPVKHEQDRVQATCDIIIAIPSQADFWPHADLQFALPSDNWRYALSALEDPQLRAQNIVTAHMCLNTTIPTVVNENLNAITLEFLTAWTKTVYTPTPAFSRSLLLRSAIHSPDRAVAIDATGQALSEGLLSDLFYFFVAELATYNKDVYEEFVRKLYGSLLERSIMEYNARFLPGILEDQAPEAAEDEWAGVDKKALLHAYSGARNRVVHEPLGDSGSSSVNDSALSTVIKNEPRDSAFRAHSVGPLLQTDLIFQPPIPPSPAPKQGDSSSINTTLTRSLGPFGTADSLAGYSELADSPISSKVSRIAAAIEARSVNVTPVSSTPS
ncbi:hypothetical protein HDZ31DRAFT_66104 [Schizophyllum fasciatum]